MIYLNMGLLNRFFKLNLSRQILISIILAISIGVTFRLNIDFLLRYHIDVAGFQILGIIFMSLLKTIIGPLVLISITSSIVSFDSISQVGKIASKTLLTFLILTLISITLAISIGYLLKPGVDVDINKEVMIKNNADKISHIRTNTVSSHSLSDVLMNIVPSNIVNSLINNDIMQIIFIATIFGLAILKNKEQSKPLVRGIDFLNSIIFSIVDLIMKLTPIAVFGLIVWLVGTQDFKLIKSLLSLVGSFYLCCIIMSYVIYPLILFLFKLNPIHFIRKTFPVQSLAFFTASSSATIGMNIETCDKLGVKRASSNFIIPLGATINMNGGAMHLCLSTIFISQLWGVDLSCSQIGLLVVLATFGAVGTAPVPGVSIFLLSGILQSLNLPMEATMIILTVDRLLDMARTTVNITGDTLSAVVVDRINKDLNVAEYKK